MKKRERMLKKKSELSLLLKDNHDSESCQEIDLFIKNEQIINTTILNDNLIAYDGYIETSEGKVGIDTIALEEDAARIIKHENNKSTFRLDRLGIPLIEIVTAPDLKSPEQIKEAALKIGEILRSCNVKRGIGTIRQDLNISTPGHPRVEIKGFQDPKIMIKTIELEVARQQSEKQSKSEVRKSLPDGTTEFLRPMPSAARMYPETDHPLLKISRQILNHAKNTLPKLTSEHRSYLKEFGLNEELVKLLVKQKKIEEFENLLQVYNNPNLVAKTLTLFNTENLDTDILEDILEAVAKNKISENDVKSAMQKISSGMSLEDAMQKEKIDLKSEITQLIKQKPNLSQGAYMGLIMAKFKGKVSGKEVMDELKKQIK